MRPTQGPRWIKVGTVVCIHAWRSPQAEGTLEQGGRLPPLGVPDPVCHLWPFWASRVLGWKGVREKPGAVATEATWGKGSTDLCASSPATSWLGEISFIYL